MAAILRVKRRCDEEPHEAFVLACKRRKTSDKTSAPVEENPITTILQFAGTVKTQTDDVTSHISNLKKVDVKTALKHTVDVSSKLRTQTRQASEINRYKVVNYFRQLQESDHLPGPGTEHEDVAKESEGSDNILTVVDVESALKENGEEGTVSEDDDKDDGGLSTISDDERNSYVYDLYYGLANDFVIMDHLLDVQPIHSVDSTNFRLAADDDTSDEEDEDDSNDESNWRNDYPDSDHSINEDDMRLAMQMGDMNMGSENELSSDDDGDLYNVEADELDVERYGVSYAMYKARVKQELSEEELSVADEDSDNSDGQHPDVFENEDPFMRFV